VVRRIDNVDNEAEKTKERGRSKRARVAAIVIGQIFHIGLSDGSNDGKHERGYEPDEIRQQSDHTPRHFIEEAQADYVECMQEK
jgi:hypothetical protein